MALLKIKYPEAYQAWLAYLTNNQEKPSTASIRTEALINSRNNTFP